MSRTKQRCIILVLPLLAENEPLVITVLAYQDLNPQGHFYIVFVSCLTAQWKDVIILGGLYDSNTINLNKGLLR